MGSSSTWDVQNVVMDDKREGRGILRERYTCARTVIVEADMTYAWIWYFVDWQ